MMKMKKLYLLMILAVVAFSSCQKIDLYEINFDDLNPENDRVLKIAVSGGALEEGSFKSTATLNGDTVAIEGGFAYNFAYSSSVPMQQVQWTFHNIGATSNEEMPHNYYGRNFFVSKVSLVGVDENGTAHGAEIWLNVLPRLAGDPVIHHATQNLGNGMFRQEFWLYKNGAFFGPGSGYKFNGTPTNWVLTDIPASDTNYRMQNGQLLTMPNDEMGKWVKAYFDSPVGNVQVAPLIRILNDYGTQWANFKGSAYADANNPGLLLYEVASNGSVTPVGGSTVVEMPGIGGDQYLRFSLNDDNVIIYQYNGPSAPNPWIQFKVNEVWSSSNVYLTATVANYPEWSQCTVARTSLPRVMRFGSDINDQLPNENNELSDFWDNVYGGLFLSLASIEP